MTDYGFASLEVLLAVSGYALVDVKTDQGLSDLLLVGLEDVEDVTGVGVSQGYLDYLVISNGMV